MTPHLATFTYCALILGLFYIDYDRKARSSWALWIPTLWLLIIGSRPVSLWFNSGPTIADTTQLEEGSPIDAMIFGILILAAIIVLSSRSQTVSRFLRANRPILLFFSYCVISVMWSDYSFVALKRVIKGVGDFVMVLVVLTDANPLAATKRLLSRGAFILIPLSILFIKYFPNIGRSYNPWTWTPMYGGVTTFKNLLGMTCLIFGIGSIWSFLAAFVDAKMPNRLWHLLAHGLIIGMAVWLFFTADSMTSLSCFGLAGIVMVVATLRGTTKRLWLIHASVVFAIALSFCALFLDSGGTLVSSLGRDATLTGRTDIWKAVLSIRINPIFGAGFESFWMGWRLDRVWDMTEKGIQEAHNGYLELYLNLGWTGLVLLSGIIVTGYLNAIEAFRRNRHTGIIRLAFVTVGIIYGLTEAGFRMMCPVWVAFLLAATAIPPVLKAKKQGTLSQTPTISAAPTDHHKSVIQEFA